MFSLAASFQNDYNLLLEYAKQEKSVEAIDRFLEEKIKSTLIVIDPIFKDCTFDKEGLSSKFREE